MTEQMSYKADDGVDFGHGASVSPRFEELGVSHYILLSVAIAHGEDQFFQPALPSPVAG